MHLQFMSNILQLRPAANYLSILCLSLSIFFFSLSGIEIDTCAVQIDCAAAHSRHFALDEI